MRKDFVVKGAPLRGELKAAGISLFYYFALTRAARTKPCFFGNETAARSVFDCGFCSGASRVAKDLMLKACKRKFCEAAAKFTQLLQK